MNIRNLKFYQLEVRQDIPKELKQLQNRCDRLEDRNRLLRNVIALSVLLIGGYLIYKTLSVEDQSEEDGKARMEE